MNRDAIVAALDTEIARLQQAKALLSGAEAPTKRGPGRPAGITKSGAATSFNPADFAPAPRKGRTMSAEGRARIAAAQKARWAKAGKAGSNTAPATAKKAAKKGLAKKTAAKKSLAQKSLAKKAISRKVAAKKAVPQAESTTTSSAA